LVLKHDTAIRVFRQAAKKGESGQKGRDIVAGEAMAEILKKIPLCFKQLTLAFRPGGMLRGCLK
jgi:hypothetical protein